MLNVYAFNKKFENTGTKTKREVEKYKIYSEILTVLL